MKQLVFILCVVLTFQNVKAQDNPFEELGYTPRFGTLSNGKYQEFHDNDTIVNIGSVLLNTKTKEIIGFVEYEVRYSEATLEPDIVSRWLSPDPLAEEYVSISPYAYVANNPVLFRDPDGMRIVADTEEAQKLISNTLTELLGDNHGFYFNKKGVLKHKGNKAHRQAKKEYSDEQNAIFSGMLEVASNDTYTIDVFQQDGSDKSYSAEFRDLEIVTDENNKIVMKNGRPVLKENGSTTIIDITSKKDGETGGGAFITRDGHRNAVAIIFPDIANNRSFKASEGKHTIPSLSATVIHELLDHGIPYVRTGSTQSSSGPSIQNVQYQNNALKIIGSPTRVKHNHE